MCHLLRRGFDWDALTQRKMKAPYVPKVRCCRLYELFWASSRGARGGSCAEAAGAAVVRQAWQLS